MIRAISLLTLITLISACFIKKMVEAPKDEIEILAFIQGKMKKIDGEWEIYENTKDMVYEVNDSCIYNKEPINCLRHGFKISYDSKGEDLQLNCVAKTNVTVNAGNVEREKYVETSEDDFYMPLRGSEKELVNIQYISGQSGLEDLYIETHCAYQEKTVLQFSQRVRFE